MPVVKKGDTVVEVIFAITIFCLVAIISISLMNNGINTAQGSLELTMARNEIDAQAEALRFIQNSFLAEREVTPDKQQFTQLWHRLTRRSDDCDHLNSCGLAIPPSQLASFDVQACSEAYGSTVDSLMSASHAFVINTRLLQPSNADFDFDDFFASSDPSNNYSTLVNQIIISAQGNSDKFGETPLHPRLLFTHAGFNTDYSSDQLVEEDDFGTSHLYRSVARAEGIWVIAVRGTQDPGRSEPEFFDFYIRTCWYEPGSDIPTAIGTIVRLYNPEVIE